MYEHRVATAFGAITIHSNAIADLVKGVVSECFVAQDKRKDRIAALEILVAKGSSVTISEQGTVDLNLYAQMTYGALLPQIIPPLRAALQSKIQDFAALTVRTINIHVEQIVVPNTSGNA